MDETDAWAARIRARHPEFETGEQAVGDFFAQWVYTGGFRDYRGRKAVCDLCGNRGLRYHFMVAHRQTGEVMWVGSECILNFDLPKGVVQSRQRQSRAAQERQAGIELSQQQLTEMLSELQAIYSLANPSEKRYLRWLLGRFQERGGFSPRELNWLFHAMLAAGTRLQAALFPLCLKSRRDKHELSLLSLSALAWLASGLSDRQRAELAKLGVRVPDRE